MTLFVEIQKSFQDFSLEVHTQIDDLTTAILGASGCGKSMTLKCIAGIEKPDRGKIYLDGQALFDSEKKINLSPQERKVGYLFQSYALFPHFTVEKNITCVINKKHKDQAKFFQALVATFQLSGLESLYPRQLSGGQQQRVAAARIVASQPQLLLFDEPFSALDTYLKEQLQIDLTNWIQHYGKQAILVTHDREEAYRMSDSLVVFENGQVMEQGKTQEIFENCQTVATARLTGCKNIVPIVKKDDDHLFVPEWDVLLTSPMKIEDKITHLGIRAHDFQRTQGSEQVNQFSVEIERVVENPFHFDVLLKRKNGKIWWKIAKENRHLLKQSSLSIVPRKLMLLK